MKLGSLFDGSGGFPLAGSINGIEPAWASEIEPYPLKVTANRFPAMKQLGDVTKISGAEIEPVDVITFGSPCQDMSVAGKRIGIHDGERSVLFFEAIRIIKEMRGATNGKYPRFAVWENVTGALSSNEGGDFRDVLQAFCEVQGETVAVPEPPKGKWKPAGCIVGDGYSIAWRVYNAQYWGVPQRRKRIYLIADFGSERAGEILFERESMRGDPAEIGETWEGAAAHAEGGSDGGCYAFHMQQDPICGNVSPCIGAQHQAPDIVTAVNTQNRHAMTYATGFNGSLGQHASGGIEYAEECAPTLRAGDVRLVAYDCRGRGNGTVVPTLTGDHQNRVSDYTSILLLKHQRKYVVRRLTPLECCRLQGFPDWWEDGVIGSDSARYKMWGNGIALPCALDVMERIARSWLCE